jgi:hypothetical protein
MKAIQKIIDRLFGHRYYAVIIGVQGSGIYEIASQIHRTKKSAEEHKQRIYGTHTYIYIETISFRSKNDFRLQ